MAFSKSGNIKGPKGDTGAQGAQGLKGDTGLPGAKGDTGAQGPQGLKGDTGAVGPQGLKGDTGAQGPQGLKGDTGATGPKGDTGATGATGTAATVAVGSTTTGAAGSSASVTNSGNSSAATLNFTVPQGLKGDKGDKGDTGATGPAGTAPTNVVTSATPTANKLTVTTTSALPAGPAVGDMVVLTDVPTPSDSYVSLDTTQNITGHKTLSGGAAITTTVKAATDPSSAYPYGESNFVVGSAQTGWPSTFGLVTTYRYQPSDEGRTYQIFRSSNAVWRRTYTASSSVWTSWVQDMDLTSAQTVVGIKTFGELRAGTVRGPSGGSLILTNAAGTVQAVLNDAGLDLQTGDLMNGGYAVYSPINPQPQTVGPVLRARQTTAQAAPAVNVWTQVALQGVDEDTWGAFASNTFTVPDNGLYQLNAGVSINSGRTAGQPTFARFNVNGVPLPGRVSGSAPSTVDTTDLALSHLRRLYIGDTVSLWNYQRTTVAAFQVSADSTSFLEAVWLQP